MGGGKHYCYYFIKLKKKVSAMPSPGILHFDCCIRKIHWKNRVLERGKMRMMGVWRKSSHVKRSWKD